MTYDKYRVNEITPHLWGRQARVNAHWAPYPIEGTLWRVQEAGTSYVLSIGTWKFEAQADWVVEVSPW